MNRTIQPAAVRRSVTVAASTAKAFKVFTDDFDRWWPRTHTIGRGPLLRAVLEPRPGGRWFGVDEDGSETPWGEVLVWDPPGRVVLAWRIGAGFSYEPDLLTEVEVRFTDLGDGRTQVDLEHRGLERMGAAGDPARAALESPNGWGGLLEMFRAAAEL